MAFGYELAKRIPSLRERDRSLYTLGCLGPDVYFFDRLPPTPFHPNQKKHGNLLHKAPCDALARAFSEAAKEALLPYVYGFLTHIALDSTLHPYICALHTGHDHTRFEGDIDAIFYARFQDRVPFAALLRRPDNLDALDALITAVSKRVVSAGERGAYARSCRKLLRLFPLLFDPNGGRFRFVSGVERLFHKEGALSAFLLAAPRRYFDDCMNEAHRPWYALPFPSTERTESVDELFSEAETLAAGMLDAALKGDYDAVCRLCAQRTMEAGPLP